MCLHSVSFSATISSVAGPPGGQFILLGGAVMAKCAICEKGAHFGNNVSHSHRRTPKMWKSNVKSVRVKTEGGSKKMYVCTSCLKSGRVERA